MLWESQSKLTVKKHQGGEEDMLGTNTSCLLQLEIAKLSSETAEQCFARSTLCHLLILVFRNIL
jgi:hypothetical protein